MLCKVAAVKGRPGKAARPTGTSRGYHLLASRVVHVNQSKYPSFAIFSVNWYWKYGSNSESSSPQRIGTSLMEKAITKMRVNAESVSSVERETEILKFDRPCRASTIFCRVIKLLRSNSDVSLLLKQVDKTLLFPLRFSEAI